MKISVWKKSSTIDGKPLYIVIAPFKGFYVVGHAKKTKSCYPQEEEVDGSFGVFFGFSLLEVSFLKLLDIEEEGYTESSWLDLLVVKGLSQESIESGVERIHKAYLTEKQQRVSKCG